MNFKRDGADDTDGRSEMVGEADGAGEMVGRFDTVGCAVGVVVGVGVGTGVGVGDGAWDRDEGQSGGAAFRIQQLFAPPCPPFGGIDLHPTKSAQ